MSSSRVVDRTFDALANEHRRGIVDRLAVGSLETPALATDFAISKQALNQHLLVLERAGLIERVRRGRVHDLHLVTTPLDGVTDWVGQIRCGWETNLDRLGLLIEDRPYE